MANFKRRCKHVISILKKAESLYFYIIYIYILRLLGKFEEAAHDLCESLKIDYDDQTNEWLNEVKPNADKIRQHNINVQRHKEEKEVFFFIHFIKIRFHERVCIFRLICPSEF